MSHLHITDYFACHTNFTHYALYTLNTSYTPNAPYTLNTPYTPNAPYTLNTPYTPNAPYTLNTPYTPNTPNAPYTLNTPYILNTPYTLLLLKQSICLLHSIHIVLLYTHNMSIVTYYCLYTYSLPSDNNVFFFRENSIRAGKAHRLSNFLRCFLLGFHYLKKNEI